MSDWGRAMLAMLASIDNYNGHPSAIRFVVDGRNVGWVSEEAEGVLRGSGLFVWSPTHITFSSALCGEESGQAAARTAAMDKALRAACAQHSWPALLGWREEQFAVSERFGGEVLFSMERSATGLVGSRRFGVHVNGYLFKDGVMHMWIARRSMKKQTYPGKLDNIVGGGVSSGMSAWQTVLKECEEEASMPEEITKSLKSVGAVSFFMYKPGWGLYPETLFVYDLLLPLTFEPTPCDGEVDAFYCMPIEEVKAAMVTEEFDPESSLVALDFLVRHAVITAESEPLYDRLVARMHRNLDQLTLVS
eukprot:m.647576 g.647576  ORF g.647576 m.647576 type:complete len:305 (+) comp58373_c0_seq21:35-949(+)